MSDDNFTKPPSPIIRRPNPIPDAGRDNSRSTDATSTAQRGEVITNNSSGNSHPVGRNKETNITLDDPPEQTEEKELVEVKKQYRLTPKFNKWVECFFDKSNKQTYMNKTHSALVAYNLDPKKDYFIAGNIGFQNYKKLENVASLVAEKNGWDFEKFMQIGWLKTMSSNSPEWWDRMGDMIGYRSMKPAVVVQSNTQNNTFVNVPEEKKKDFNDQFRNFIKAT